MVVATLYTARTIYTSCSLQMWQCCAMSLTLDTIHLPTAASNLVNVKLHLYLHEAAGFYPAKTTSGEISLPLSPFFAQSVQEASVCTGS